MSLPYQVLQVRTNASKAPRAPPSKEEMQGPESLDIAQEFLNFFAVCVWGWGGGSVLWELNRWYIISLRVGSGSFWLGFRSFELLRVQDSDVRVTISLAAASTNLRGLQSGCVGLLERLKGLGFRDAGM